MSKRLRDTTHRLFEYIDNLDDHLGRSRQMLKQLPSVAGQRGQIAQSQKIIQDTFSLVERMGQLNPGSDVQKSVQFAEMKAQAKSKEDEVLACHRKMQEAMAQLEKVAVGLSQLMDQIQSKTPELKRLTD